MKRSIIAGLALALSSSLAFADSKPSADEAKKITEALAALGCDGGEQEKETEGSGAYEVDDAKCKFGGQWDIKLNKEFGVTSLTRD